MSTDWNAARYHELSEPQFQWGLAVLARLPLRGDETVVDAGCGTGRLTAELLERLPRGRVIAVDRSASMLEKARDHLVARFGARVRFIQSDLQDLPLSSAADVIFSTATFHWVLDHDRLFERLFAALVPGGRLHAQCGGGPNLERIMTRTRALMTNSVYAPWFTGWRDTTCFASPEETASRMVRAGFVDVHTSLEAAPAVFPDAARFKEFVSVVVLRTHLERLPPTLHDRFTDALVAQAASDTPPFTLDYWRLNTRGRR